MYIINIPLVSGPGYWEDLDVGASDTYVSPCSFDAAVAAAAVVCAGTFAYYALI
jgi:hypothetical protein